MKVLHLINLQGFGGVEKRFAMYLMNSSFDNYIICTSNYIDSNISNLFNSKKIKFSNRIFNSLNIKWPTFIRKLVLKNKINNIGADIIIAWDFIPKIKAKPINSKIIYYDCGCGWRYPVNQKTACFFNLVDSIISNSYASKRVLQLRYSLNKNIDVVLNRLNFPVAKIPKILPQNKLITLGTASRLVGLKGIGVSILTLSVLIKRGIKAKLIIAGSGDEKAKLTSLMVKLSLQEHIDFIGYQSDMKDFYSNIDIYLSTPVTEAFGLSCIEALSHGIPVVYPMIDGQPEAVKDKFCGIGIPPSISVEKYFQQTGLNADFPYDVYDPINDCLTTPKLIDPNKCADAIQHIISDYEQLSENALTWSKQTMDYDLFIKEFEQSISSLKK